MCDPMQEEVPPLNVNVCSLIKSFLEILTAGQSLRLMRGHPDPWTKTLLTDLIVQIIRNFSTALHSHISFTNTTLTMEVVDSCLSNRVIDSFKEALEVTTEGIGISAEGFRHLIAEEVMLSIISYVEDGSQDYVPDPIEMHKLVTLASKMIKGMKNRVRISETGETSTPVEDFKSGEPFRPGLHPRRQCWCDTPSSGSGSATEPTEELTPEVIENTCNDTTSQVADFSNEEEIRRNAILTVVEKLVLLTYLKCGVGCPFTEPEIIIEHLMKRTWAEVKDVDFDSSPEKLAFLEKAIFKGLVKKWDAAEVVLFQMKERLPALERFVIDAIKNRLTSPPKKRCSSICRFFSSMGRTIAGFCKRSGAVD